MIERHELHRLIQNALRRSRVFALRMKALQFIAAVFALCSCAFGGQSAKDSSWRLVKPEISLGIIAKDQPVQVTFKIKNGTTKPIKIAAAEGACRCTSLLSAPTDIPALGIGTFKFLFSPALSEGSVTKMVTVDDADGRTLVGTFTAFVK
jgi:hypothetical protein